MPTKRWMIALGALALAGTLAAFLSAQPSRHTNASAEGSLLLRPHVEPRPLSGLVFEDGEGRTRSLAEFRERVVLLNLWATWCLPCREEMPALDRLQRILGGAEFEVVALSIDSGGAPAVKRFYDEFGIAALAVYVDPASAATTRLSTMGIPTTLLIDRQGREIARHLGPAQWDAPAALRAIEVQLYGSEKP